MGGGGGGRRVCRLGVVVHPALRTALSVPGRRLQPAGKRALAVLHVSPRYGKVDAKLLGIQRSRDMKRKIAEGRCCALFGKILSFGVAFLDYLPLVCFLLELHAKVHTYMGPV